MVDLGRRTVVKTLMKPLMVVKVKIVGQAVKGVFGRDVFTGIDLLILNGAPQSLREDVLKTRPLPSILIWTSPATSRWIYCGLVKWLPWSLFQIRGRLCASALSILSSTKSMSKV
jgi:hypothetical protein